jgi:hypothetical protein
MSPEDEWEPIQIVKRQVDPQRGPGVAGIPNVTLTFTLSAEPDNVWAGFFRDAPSGRSGTGAFVQAPRPVLSGWLITWTVPKRDMEGAWKSVKADVDQANARYPQHQSELRASVLKAQEVAVASKKELDELQRLLDSFD